MLNKIKIINKNKLKINLFILHGLLNWNKKNKQQSYHSQEKKLFFDTNILFLSIFILYLPPFLLAIK
jgi:hypothetical protein